MYYKKLEKLYRESNIEKEFGISLLVYFDNFLRDEIQHGYQYFNPYKFALDYGLSVEDSIKIFLTFTDEDKIFKAEPFVDCNNCSGKKLPFNLELLLKNDNFICCEDCGECYEKGEIEKDLYIYFKLNANITMPDEKQQVHEYDLNSTYDLLQRMDSHLKSESPSTTFKNKSSQVEGEFQSGVPIKEIKTLNTNIEGKPRSESLSNLEQDLMNSYLDRVK